MDSQGDDGAVTAAHPEVAATKSGSDDADIPRNQTLESPVEVQNNAHDDASSIVASGAEEASPREDNNIATGEENSPTPQVLEESRQSAQPATPNVPLEAEDGNLLESAAQHAQPAPTNAGERTGHHGQNVEQAKSNSPKLQQRTENPALVSNDVLAQPAAEGGSTAHTETAGTKDAPQQTEQVTAQVATEVASESGLTANPAAEQAEQADHVVDQVDEAAAASTTDPAHKQSSPNSEGQKDGSSPVEAVDHEDRTDPGEQAGDALVQVPQDPNTSGVGGDDFVFVTGTWISEDLKDWAEEWMTACGFEGMDQADFLRAFRRVVRCDFLRREHYSSANAQIGTFDKRRPNGLFVKTISYQTRSMHVFFCPEQHAWKIAWHKPGKAKEQNCRLLFDAQEAKSDVEGRCFIKFKDRELELKPLDETGRTTWALIEWLFRSRTYEKCAIPAVPDEDTSVTKDLLRIIMAIQDVEPEHQVGYFARPNWVRWLIVLNFLSAVREEDLNITLRKHSEGNKRRNGVQRVGLAFHPGQPVYCSFCYGKAYAASRVRGVDDLILCLACMKTVHASGSSNRTYDDDGAGLSNGDGGGGPSMATATGRATNETAVAASSLRNVQRDHPAFRRVTYEIQPMVGAGRGRVADGYWCSLCVQFQAPQSCRVCQTCKAMICKRSHCAVRTVTESTSLEKYECRGCWRDRWYSSVKDSAGEVLLGSRVFPGHLPNWFHCVFFKTSTTEQLPTQPIEAWRAVYHATTFDLIQGMLYGTRRQEQWTAQTAQLMMNSVLIHDNVDNVVSFLRWWVPTPPIWNRSSHALDAPIIEITSQMRVQKIEQLDFGISRCDFLTDNGLYVPDSASYEDSSEALINCPYLFLSPKDSIIYNKDKLESTQVFVGRSIGARDGNGRDTGNAQRSTIVLTPQLMKGKVKSQRGGWFSRKDKSSSVQVRKPIQMSERTKWTVALVGTIVRSLVHELYASECAALCNVHSSLFYVDRYIDDWKLIHGPYHVNILNELRKALLGLYEAHRYFVVWLKDELFPSKSSAEELSILKSKHLEQKFAPMGGSPANMSALKSAPDSKDVATALINARRDWRAMHGESADGMHLLSSLMDAMTTWFMPKLIVPLWRCALSCDYTVQWMKVGVTTKSQLRCVDDISPRTTSPNVMDTPRFDGSNTKRHPHQGDDHSSTKVGNAMTPQRLTDSFAEVAFQRTSVDVTQPRMLQTGAPDDLLTYLNIPKSANNTTGVDLLMGQAKAARDRGFLHEHTFEHMQQLASTQASETFVVLRRIFSTALVISVNGVPLCNTDFVLTWEAREGSDNGEGGHAALCPYIVDLLHTHSFPSYFSGVLRDTLGVRCLGDLALFVTADDLQSVGIGKASAERLVAVVRTDATQMLCSSQSSSSTSNGRVKIPSFGTPRSDSSSNSPSAGVCPFLVGAVRAFVELVPVEIDAQNIKHSLSVLHPLDRWSPHLANQGLMPSGDADDSPHALDILLLTAQDLERARCPQPLVRKFQLAQSIAVDTALANCHSDRAAALLPRFPRQMTLAKELLAQLRKHDNAISELYEPVISACLSTSIHPGALRRSHEAIVGIVKYVSAANFDARQQRRRLAPLFYLVHHTSCETVIPTLLAFGFDQRVIPSFLNAKFLSCFGIQGLLLLNEDTFAGIVTKRSEQSKGTPDNNSLAPRLRVNTDNTHLPSKSAGAAVLDQQLALFRRVKHLLPALVFELPMYRTTHIEQVPSRAWLFNFFPPRFARKVHHSLCVDGLSDVSYITAKDLLRLRRRSSSGTCSHCFRFDPASTAASMGRGCVSTFHKVVQHFFKTRLNVPTVLSLQATDMATPPQIANAAATGVESSLRRWLSVHNMSFVVPALAKAGVTSWKDVEFADFSDSSWIRGIRLRKLHHIAAIDPPQSTSAEATNVHRWSDDAIADVAKVVPHQKREPPPTTAGHSRSNRLTQMSAIVLGQSRSTPETSPGQSQDVNKDKVLRGRLNSQWAANIVVDANLRRLCACATILFAWRRFKQNKAHRILQSAHTKLSRSIAGGRELFFGSSGNVPTRTTSAAASTAALRSAQMFAALVRPQECVLDFQLLIDRAIDVAKGLDYGPIFAGCEKDTQSFAENIKRVAPGLLEQLRRLAENLTVPATSATVRNLTKLQVFKRWINAERRRAAQRFARRSLFQRFVREPHFLSAWPNKKIRIRVKYLKEVVAQGKLKQLDHGKFYFRIDIRHGPIFVAALRPSKSHSATLRHQQTVARISSRLVGGDGVNDSPVADADVLDDEDVDTAAQEWDRAATALRHKSQINVWFESTVPASKIPVSSKIRIAIFRHTKENDDLLMPDSLSNADDNKSPRAGKQGSPEARGRRNTTNSVATVDTLDEGAVTDSSDIASRLSHAERTARSDLNMVAALYLPIAEFTSKGPMWRYCTATNASTRASSPKPSDDTQTQNTSPFNDNGKSTDDGVHAGEFSDEFSDDESDDFNSEEEADTLAPNQPLLYRQATAQPFTKHSADNAHKLPPRLSFDISAQHRTAQRRRSLTANNGPARFAPSWAPMQEPSTDANAEPDSSDDELLNMASVRESSQRDFPGYKWQWVSGFRTLHTNYHSNDTLGVEARVQRQSSRHLKRAPADIYRYRPQSRPFPRVYSCSAGHACVDNLVAHSTDMADCDVAERPTSFSPKRPSYGDLPNTASPKDWTVPMVRGGEPQWVILDAGPDTFVSGICLKLRGRRGCNPRHCRLVSSSSPSNPLKGWVSGVDVDFTIPSPESREFLVPVWKQARFWALIIADNFGDDNCVVEHVYFRSTSEAAVHSVRGTVVQGEAAAELGATPRAEHHFTMEVEIENPYRPPGRRRREPKVAVHPPVAQPLPFALPVARESPELSSSLRSDSSFMTAVMQPDDEDNVEGDSKNEVSFGPMTPVGASPKNESVEIGPGEDKVVIAEESRDDAPELRETVVTEAKIVFGGRLFMEPTPVCSASDISTGQQCILPATVRINKRCFCNWHNPSESAQTFATASSNGPLPVEHLRGENSRGKVYWVELVKTRRRVITRDSDGETSVRHKASAAIAWDCMYLRAYEGRVAAARSTRYGHNLRVTTGVEDEHARASAKIDVQVGFACRWNATTPLSDIGSCRQNYFDVQTAFVDKGISLKHIRELFHNDSFVVSGFPSSRSAIKSLDTAVVYDASDSRSYFCRVLVPRGNRHCVDAERVAWINVLNNRVPIGETLRYNEKCLHKTLMPLLETLVECLPVPVLTATGGNAAAKHASEVATQDGLAQSPPLQSVADALSLICHHAGFQTFTPADRLSSFQLAASSTQAQADSVKCVACFPEPLRTVPQQLNMLQTLTNRLTESRQKGSLLGTAVSFFVSDSIQDGILALGPILKLTEVERAVMRGSRVDSDEEQRSAAARHIWNKVLVTNWNSPSCMRRALHFLGSSRDLVRKLTNPQNGGDPSYLLTLLHSSVQSSEVRAFAVRCLKRCELSANALRRMLLQLVQSLKGESRCFSALFDFLMEVAIRDPMDVGLALFWIVRTEIDTKDGLNGIGEVFLRHFLDYLGDGILRATFEDQARLWSKSGLFAQLNQYIRNPMDAVPVEGDADNKAAGTRPSGVAPPSAQFDCVGALKQHNRVNEVVRVLYKVDDDLRQDQLVLDLLRLMQQLWNSCGVGDLHVACYHATPTWKDGGLLLIVPDSQTLFKIDNELGGIARYLKLDDESVSPAAKDAALTKFARSLAGYCVASKILGFGDRHNDNVMISQNGRFFHIDFGFCFGRRTQKLGFARQKFPFVYTAEMHEVLTTHHRHSDGRTFHSIFLDVCRQAYLCIRLHHERILRFVLPLVDAGMTDLNMETVQHIRSQVRLELTEEAAWAAFETELDMCSRDNSKRIDETGRRVAKILSKDNTIEQTELLRHELTKLQLQIGFNVLLPFGLKVGPVVPEKCSVMRSKAKPFMLAFQAPPEWSFAKENAKYLQ